MWLLLWYILQLCLPLLCFFLAIRARGCFSCLCPCRKQGHSTFYSHSLHLSMLFNSNSVQLCTIFAPFHSVLVRQWEMNGRCFHLHRLWMETSESRWPKVTGSGAGLNTRIAWRFFVAPQWVVNRHFCSSLWICITWGAGTTLLMCCVSAAVFVASSGIHCIIPHPSVGNVFGD